MSITTYSELQTAVARWLKRSDLDSQIPDFITFCEADFNRNLRLQTMETRVTATLDEQYEDLPDDYLEMRRLKITGVDGKPLQYCPPEAQTLSNPDDAVGSTVTYSIIGTEIEFSRPPNGSYSMEMVYYKRIPALSDDEPTNWMLGNCPDLYLFGTLLQAAPYLMNDTRIPVWEAKYAKVLEDIRGEDVRKRHSGSPLVMRVGVSS